MSYARRRARALGSVQSTPSHGRRPPRAFGSLGGESTLGDDPQNTQDWQANVLQTLQTSLIVENQRRQDEKFRGWVQIAVTASIPILGVMWKWLLARREL